MYEEKVRVPPPPPGAIYRQTTDNSTCNKQDKHKCITNIEQTGNNNTHTMINVTNRSSIRKIEQIDNNNKHTIIHVTNRTNTRQLQT